MAAVHYIYVRGKKGPVRPVAQLSVDLLVLPVTASSHLLTTTSDTTISKDREITIFSPTMTSVTSLYVMYTLGDGKNS